MLRCIDGGEVGVEGGVGVCSCSACEVVGVASNAAIGVSVHGVVMGVCGVPRVGEHTGERVDMVRTLFRFRIRVHPKTKFGGLRP